MQWPNEKDKQYNGQMKKDKQLESLESDIRKLNVELDKKDDIIYSHKQHNNQDHNAGNWSQFASLISFIVFSVSANVIAFFFRRT
jgi:hypothetical protein